MMITSQLKLIINKGADRRRENLPIINKIALLIPGKNNKSENRDLILIKRSARSASD
jgi:hypothetical protein